MSGKKNSTRTLSIIALVAVVLLAIGLVTLYIATRPSTDTSDKNITVSVIHKSGEEKVFEYETDREYLGEALVDEELISGEQGAYGMFMTTVDGYTADDTNEEWWCLTKGGETVFTGVDTTPIADGEQYELTLMVGYDQF